MIPVESGSRTLKDAINEAMRDWVTNVVDTHYLIGSAIGPHPFPTLVRDFQSVIGKEARAQVTIERRKEYDVNQIRVLVPIAYFPFREWAVAIVVLFFNFSCGKNTAPEGTDDARVSMCVCVVSCMTAYVLRSCICSKTQ